MLKHLRSRRFGWDEFESQQRAKTIDLDWRLKSNIAVSPTYEGSRGNWLSYFRSVLTKNPKWTFTEDLFALVVQILITRNKLGIWMTIFGFRHPLLWVCLSRQKKEELQEIPFHFSIDFGRVSIEDSSVSCVLLTNFQWMSIIPSFSNVNCSAASNLWVFTVSFFKELLWPVLDIQNGF